jgi:hypothetical protein
MQEPKNVHHPRYRVGYNRPVAGAIGNSPKEFHIVAETDDLDLAVGEMRRECRERNAAYIWDDVSKSVVTVVYRPDLPQPAPEPATGN